MKEIYLISSQLKVQPRSQCHVEYSREFKSIKLTRSTTIPGKHTAKYAKLAAPQAKLPGFQPTATRSRKHFLQNFISGSVYSTHLTQTAFWHFFTLHQSNSTSLKGE